MHSTRLERGLAAGSRCQPGRLDGLVFGLRVGAPQPWRGVAGNAQGVASDSPPKISTWTNDQTKILAKMRGLRCQQCRTLDRYRVGASPAQARRISSRIGS
jgi:hypothetical protein